MSSLGGALQNDEWVDSLPEGVFSVPRGQKREGLSHMDSFPDFGHNV